MIVKESYKKISKQYVNILCVTKTKYYRYDKIMLEFYLRCSRIKKKKNIHELLFLYQVHNKCHNKLIKVEIKIYNSI